MRIFYLGKFNRSYSTENYVTSAFRQLGHVVTCQQITSSMNGSQLFSKVRESQSDIVLFSKPFTPCYCELIQNCRQTKILTVVWLWDLYWSYRHASRGPLRMPPNHAMAADLVFSTDGGHEKQWRDAKVNHHVVRQGIHEPEHVMFQPSGRQRQLVFVGSWRTHHVNLERQRLVRWLRSTYGDGISFYDSTRGLALNQLLADADVVVGDSYPSDSYWSNRIYEILGRGGFLLHPRTIGLDAEFSDGDHYVGYDRSDLAGLRGTIDYWLSHKSEREIIRQSGFEQAGLYTYAARCRDLIACLPCSSTFT